MTTKLQPMCMECKRLRRDAPGMTCDAFPDGIPAYIVENKVDHRVPVVGDHGLQFVPVEGAVIAEYWPDASDLAEAEVPESGEVYKSEYDEESARIRESAKEWGGRTHRFVAAEWTHPNGHPRCARCGDEEPADGLCMPELLKYAAMLDAWATKFNSKWNGTMSEGEPMPRNWIEEFHSDCLTKGEACAVKWPVCPVKASVEKFIREKDGKFVVYSEAGKVLGTHDTKAEAVAQLRAIEANKTKKDDAKVEVEFKPTSEALVALRAAFREYATAKGIVFKAEEVMAEPVGPGVVQVAHPGGRAYFSVEGDKVARLEHYHQRPTFAPVAKAERQRYTLGAVYAPGEVDFHGDTMSEAELEKSAWAFAQKDGLAGRVGLMHKAGTDGAGRVVESYVYRGPEWKFKDTAGNEQTIVPGTWMLGVVWDQEGWQQIERGEIKGYSLQGVATKWQDGKEM